jgi:ABC-2 type transport system permease protein
MHPILRLINRNLTVSLNPGFLIWQVIFPLIYIFVVGFAYTSLIPGVMYNGSQVAYPAFLATGMIGFNIMNSTLVSGLIIWNDRRHGMFEQIMSGPYTRMQYVLANICTIGIVGTISAALIVGVGYPVFQESAEFTLYTVPLIVFAAVTGSVLFGSLASIISTRLTSSEGFNVVINTTFIFLAFASTAFYPAEGTPAGLGAVFYFNPLTYLVDAIRAGIFGGITQMVVLEMVALSAIAATLFVVATKMMTKVDF